jgi:hypothetical protein
MYCNATIILFVGLRIRRRQISRFWKIKIIEIWVLLFYRRSRKLHQSLENKNNYPAGLIFSPPM